MDYCRPGLVPRDYWEHRLSDLLSGGAAALTRRIASESLFLPGIGECLPLRSGRSALTVALQALALGPGAQVGVPLYCCPVVFDAIEAAGAKALFLDIDSETFCVSPAAVAAKRSRLNAVIAVHMFGNMCDMPELQAAADGLPIIEDCAQALGSKLEGRPAGTFGAAAVFSFRSGKYLSAGEGGAVVSAQAEIRARLAQAVSTLGVPSVTQECAHLAAVYLKSLLRSRPLYGLAGYPLWNYKNSRRKMPTKGRIALSRIFKSDLAVARRRLARLDSTISKQRANAACLSVELHLDAGMLCEEAPGAYYNRYSYPVRFSSVEHRDWMAAYLRRRGVDNIKFLDDIVEVATQAYGYPGGCPEAETLSKRVLLVPSYHSLAVGEVQRIARLVGAGWARIQAAKAPSEYLVV